MEAKHTDDLWNVNEGDDVTITVTEDKPALDLHCTHRSVQRASERSGEVKDTTLWMFVSGDFTVACTITQGLASDESELGEYPKHTPVTKQPSDDEELFEGFGYIESLQIHGPRLES